MYNELYDITALEKNIQDRLMKNYELEANRAKIGHVASECFWTRQALADIVIEALPMARYFNPEVQESLYNIYLKMNAG